MKKEIFSKTGARVGITISLLATAFSPIMATPVYADVPPSYIVGEAQTEENRQPVKVEEAQAIIAKFHGFDREGNQTITMEEIERAIRLSKALNEYLYDPLKFTNARSSEVINLDINAIYDYYVRAYEAGTDQDLEYFFKNTLPEKPAIDAYITFVSGTLSNNLKKELCTRVSEVISSEGRTITTAPRIIINDKEIYCLVEVDGHLEKLCFVGDGIQEIKDICQSLDQTYNLAINNISGASLEHDNTFMYNGIDSITNESAWLSLPEDAKRDKLEEGIALYRTLQIHTNYELRSNDPITLHPLTEEEKQELRNLAYNEDQIMRAGKKEVILDKMINKMLQKLN